MINLYKQHKGKNVYKITSKKLLTIEQYVIADNEDEAFDKWLDEGNLKNDKINTELTNETSDIETDYIDADTGEHDTKYIGKVVTDPDSEFEEDLIVDESIEEVKI
jgi:hypothetical protein